MFPTTHSTPDIHTRLLNFLRDNRALTGAKVVCALLAQPGVRIELLELCRRLYYPQVSPEFVTLLRRHAFTPVPLADRYAVAQYLARLRALRRSASAGPSSPETEWEIQWLERELRRVCRPGLGVKSEAPELKNAYAALRMGVIRLLRKALAADPELHSYLRLHLKTGYHFSWSVANISETYSIAISENTFLKSA